PERRMGKLEGPRRHVRVLEAVELALVAERFALPRLEDDFERFVEARLALRVVDAVDVVDTWEAAAAAAEVEAAVAELADRGRLRRDAQRIVERQDLHGGPHAKPLGPRGDGGGDGDRRGQHRAAWREVHLAEPGDVEAPGFGDVDEVKSFLKRSD